MGEATLVVVYRLHRIEPFSIGLHQLVPDDDVPAEARGLGSRLRQGPRLSLGGRVARSEAKTCDTLLSCENALDRPKPITAKGGSNSVVECQLPKLDVAGSTPVSRSIFKNLQAPRKPGLLRLLR
jgi:hypothetical protein